MLRGLLVTVAAVTAVAIPAATATAAPPATNIVATCSSNSPYTSTVSGFKGNPSYVQFIWTLSDGTQAQGPDDQNVGGKYGDTATEQPADILPGTPALLTYTIVYKHSSTTGTVSCTSS